MTQDKSLIRQSRPNHNLLWSDHVRQAEVVLGTIHKSRLAETEHLRRSAENLTIDQDRFVAAPVLGVGRVRVKRSKDRQGRLWNMIQLLRALRPPINFRVSQSTCHRRLVDHHLPPKRPYIHASTPSEIEIRVNSVTVSTLQISLIRHLRGYCIRRAATTRMKHRSPLLAREVQVQ